MSIEKVTNLGSINISQEAIATLAGGVVGECYGVVGMASQKLLRDGLFELLKQENYSKGVVVNKSELGIDLDIYVILSYGVRISEVVTEVQKKVKYVLEKTLQQELHSVNVYVQGIQVIS